MGRGIGGPGSLSDAATAVTVSTALAAIAGIIWVAFLLTDDGVRSLSSESGPVAVVAEWFAAFERGDVETYQDLIAADAWWECRGCAPPVHAGPYFGGSHGADLTEARDSLLTHAAQGSVSATCTAEGVQVTCEVGRSDLFRTSANLAPYRYGYEVTVEGGSITNLVFISIHSDRYLSGSQIGAYERWLMESHPDDHQDLFLYGTMIVEPVEKAERHRRLVAQWHAAR